MCGADAAEQSRVEGDGPRVIETGPAPSPDIRELCSGQEYEKGPDFTSAPKNEGYCNPTCVNLYPVVPVSDER